jgi:hypothetical protein
VVGKAPKSRHAPMEPMVMGDMKQARAQNNPCLGGMVVPTSTNIHFHGLNIAPVSPRRSRQDHHREQRCALSVFISNSRKRSSGPVLVPSPRARILRASGLWRCCRRAHYRGNKFADTGSARANIDDS